MLEGQAASMMLVLFSQSTGNTELETGRTHADSPEQEPELLGNQGQKPLPIPHRAARDSH